MTCPASHTGAGCREPGTGFDTKYKVILESDAKRSDGKVGLRDKGIQSVNGGSCHSEKVEDLVTFNNISTLVHELRFSSVGGVL